MQLQSGFQEGPTPGVLDTLAVSAVAGVMTLDRRTLTEIRGNRVIGLVTPAVGLALAGAGVLTPLSAAVFGVVGVLLVVANSLRLRGDAI